MQSISTQRSKNEQPGRPNPRTVRILDNDYSRSHTSSPTPEVDIRAKTASKCPNPECDGTETAEDGGQVICTECGAVVSDKQLTQDVQFGEAANGQAIVQGVHVGEGQETARPAPGSSRVMGGTASKEMAVSDARRELTRLASNPGWNIRQHDIEKAERVFKLAYNFGHTKGRDRTHICAVCLYIAIRQRPPSEGTLMLIDFADFVNVSVFYLGRLYTELCAEIRINHEATVYQIRPELLAHRFCEELGLGEDTYRVALEAVNIIKRMNRDWLVLGRRPSGIVGAAVILAARMNNYRRTVRELVYTAKVCEYTITKRLDEFRCTPVSKLTVSEVRGKDWDQVAPEAVGPPSLYPEAFKPKRDRKRKRSRLDAEVEAAPSTASSVQAAASADESNTESVPSDEEQDEQPPQSQGNSRKNINRASANLQGVNETSKERMTSPASGQLNIDPELLRASSQALKDMGDDENAEKLEKTSKRRRADSNDEDEESQEESGFRSRNRPKRQHQARPLPEPSADTIADEDQLEADINAQLQNSDMLTYAGQVHKETSDRPLPPEDPEDDGQTGSNSRQPTQDVEEGHDESEVLEQYFGFFHHVRPEYEEHDDNDRSESQGKALLTDAEWTSLNHKDIQLKYTETMKHTKELLLKYPVTTAGLLAKVPSTEEISDSEFADDPDVNDMILEDSEREIKEAVWISKYGKHLKERHLKKVQKLIDEENGITKQPRRRNTKKPKPGDDSGYARDKNGKVADGWIGVIKATFEHRGSNKLNYNAIGKILESGSPSTGSNTMSRAPSVVRSMAGSFVSRQGTPTRVTKPVTMPRLPKDGKVPTSAAYKVPSAGKDSGSLDRSKDQGDQKKGNEEDEYDPAEDFVGGAGGDDDDYDDEDEDDDLPDLTNVSEEVRNRMNAGMSYEDALAADQYGGF